MQCEDGWSSASMCHCPTLKAVLPFCVDCWRAAVVAAAVLAAAVALDEEDAVVAAVATEAAAGYGMRCHVQIWSASLQPQRGTVPVTCPLCARKLPLVRCGSWAPG